MNLDFLTPLDNDLLEESFQQSSLALFHQLQIHSKQKGFPNLEGIDIALFGVLENRREENGVEKKFTFNKIRKKLYGLFPGNWHLKIADLGDIPAGATVEDTYFALRSVISELLKRKIVPIILGGSQDLVYAQYRAYDDFGQMVNLVNIDSTFDLGDAGKNISNKSYIGKMILDEPFNLFNYSNIGYQTYFNPQEEIELMERLYFDAYRLGDIGANLELSEPVLRDANLVCMDIGALNAETLRENTFFSPNGFNGKEICTLARYTGISDKVSSFGIYELQKLETSESAFLLTAEIIWYFIEGMNYRKNEHTLSSKNQFIKYQVPIKDEILVFYKSGISERWWIELPFSSNVNNKLKKHTLLPCTNQDYLDACNQEIPERWYKARKKNEI
ncbi:MAG TPA: formimidoylglutamase [Flavobacteriaceae bacterium]|nr:formimidoylglutamase [Flavobacteriaceae bacterium]